jgi:glutathione S-transferase
MTSGRNEGVQAKAQLRYPMSRLRIYGIARTRAFRAIWIAKELGLPYQHIPTEIGPAGARKPEYLS